MTDNKKVLKVLNGFLQLNDDEKRVLLQESREYQNSDSFTKSSKKRLVESKLSVGPTGTDHCPCCGKS